jgi:5,5'-dehydrodivanillate O-demethylase
VDDEHMLYVWCNSKYRAPDQPLQRPEEVPLWENEYLYPDGRFIIETISGQDMMAWVTQGPLTDRTTERLGTSDQGVILFRQLLEENMRKVERGEDPLGVVRDPAKVTPMIKIAREEPAFRASGPNRELFAVRKEVAATK